MLLPTPIVLPLVDTLASQLHPDDRPSCTAAVNAHIADLVAGQAERSPFYVGLAFAILTRLFNLTALLRSGRTFSNAPEKARAAHVRRWQQSRIKLFRDFVSFYQSFVVLGIHERGDQ